MYMYVQSGDNTSGNCDSSEFESLLDGAGLMPRLLWQSDMNRESSPHRVISVYIIRCRCSMTNNTCNSTALGYQFK